MFHWLCFTSKSELDVACWVVAETLKVSLVRIRPSVMTMRAMPSRAIPRS
jgi:hypothetical protein